MTEKGAEEQVLAMERLRGNSLLAQTIPTAKPENPYRYQDRLLKM